MKTIRNLLLMAAFMFGLNQLQAQCLSYNTSSNALSAQFNAYLFDSASIVGSTYFWEFGDGDTAQSFIASHNYAQSGTYNACFHYTSASCNNDTCFNVVVDSCAYNLYIYATNNSGLTSFGAANIPNGSTYLWTASGPSGFSNTSTNSTLSFTVPGTGYYYIHVAVTTPNGCIDTTSQYVHLNSPCAPNFYLNATGNNTEVQFYAGQYDSINPGSYTYTWKFGDGSTSAASNPLHTYPTYGSYTVCLAISGNGCYDSTCKIITVYPPSYLISGNVNYTGSGNCSSKALLITDTAGYLSLVSEYSSFIDSSCQGHFSFYVPSGTYYIKGVLNPSDPNYANYLPTYYGDELLWADATPITVTNSNISNLNINMIAGVNPGGPGFVGGWVTQGAGLAIGGNNEHRGIGDPLPNIQVNLVTDNDVPVAYAYTDANGRYIFSNLALGTYKVYAEEINKVPSPMSVTLTANNPSQDNVDVSINSNSAVTGINDLFDLQVEGLFPNPVTDKATLTVLLKQNSSAQLRVIDTKGSILTNEPIKLNAGANKIDINLSGKPAGIYLISLQGEAGSKIIRVAKAN